MQAVAGMQAEGRMRIEGGPQERFAASLAARLAVAAAAAATATPLGVHDMICQHSVHSVHEMTCQHSMQGMTYQYSVHSMHNVRSVRSTGQCAGTARLRIAVMAATLSMTTLHANAVGRRVGHFLVQTATILERSSKEQSSCDARTART
jgi:hypothetical protein